MQMQKRLYKKSIFLLFYSLITVCILGSASAGVKTYKPLGSNNVISNQDGTSCDGDFEFRGTIQSLPNTAGFIGDWVVNGRTVRVSSRTEIERKSAQVAVGAFVEVEGCLQTDGSVLAKEIEVGAPTGGEA